MQTATFDNPMLTTLRPRLFAYARRALRDQSDAEDVTQETLLALLQRSSPPFRGEASLLTYATAILKNKIADLVRARVAQRRAHASAAADAACHDDAAPDGCTLLARQRRREQFWPRLRLQLRALPAQTREAFVLRLLYDCDVQETCRRMRISPNHTAVLTSRARQKLRRSWDRAALQD